MAFGVDGTPEADEIIRTRLEKCLNSPKGHTVFFDQADTRTCPRCGINRPFAATPDYGEDWAERDWLVRVPRIQYVDVRLI